MRFVCSDWKERIDEINGGRSVKDLMDPNGLWRS